MDWGCCLTGHRVSSEAAAAVAAATVGLAAETVAAAAPVDADAAALRC